MSEIREYLEGKAALPEKEWLRREPRETHPAILAAVREFEAGGGFYDDEAERYVEAVAGDLPEHYYHAHEKRDRLTSQLGHEVYIAKGIISDEGRREKEASLLAEGYAEFDGEKVVEGGRYEIRLGTKYVGGDAVSWGSEVLKVRAIRHAGGWAFMRKGARTRGFLPLGSVLIREGWS